MNFTQRPTTEIGSIRITNGRGLAGIKFKMKEHPILFSGDMAKAILDGRKTQTRRIVKPQPVEVAEPSGNSDGLIRLKASDDCLSTWSDACPYGQAADHLWVKETFLNNALSGYPPVYFYRADSKDKPEDRKWKPSIFMPRIASRITLEITAVRVERLQDISSKDALAEGVDYDVSKPDGWPIDRYRKLWESINGKGSWDKNPWVWVLEFKRIEP